MLRRLGGWLSSAHGPWGVVLLAILLTLPALGSGWEIDDLIHRSYILEHQRAPWDIFGFLAGDPEVNRALVYHGAVPWWTLDELKVSFWRPLTSLTHWLDYQLWPNNAPLMHAHSLLWFAAGVLVLASVYRRLMGPTLAAGLAALLFAIDDARMTPAGWLANRNALPAFFFGMLALAAHHRCRADGWRPGGWLTPLLLLAAVCSAEAGVATMAYLLSYALFVDPAPRRRALASLLPCFAVLLIWRLVYSGLGYGTSGSGFYTDPAGDPLRFAGVLASRAPILLLAQWLLPPMNFDGLMAIFGPNWIWTLAAVGGLALLAGVLLPVLKRDRLTRFWAAGMLLSLPPVCATIPMNRLLMFVGVGAFALLARFITQVWDPEYSGSRRGLRRGVAVGLLVLHAVLAPIALAVMIRYVVPPEVKSQVFIETPLGPEVARQTVVVMNAPSVFHAGYSPMILRLQNRPFPEKLFFLCPSWSGVTLHRTDPRTVVVSADTGYLVRPLDVLFRAAHQPIVAEEPISLALGTVEVTRLTDDGRPAEARFRFEKPLEHPALRWICWSDGSFRECSPPAVGERLVLPAPVLPGGP